MFFNFLFSLVKTKFQFLNCYDVPPANADSSCFIDIKIFWMEGISRVIPVVTLYEDIYACGY